ncbi:MAG: glycosyltransferase family 25 protein [Parachlamydiaceae bacterium]|nr:glycosyltransferase family 25 protein [Parachlamydiaceae bacterium]
MYDFALHETSPHIVHECIVSHKDNTAERHWDIPIKTIAKQQLDSMSYKELDADWQLNDFFGTIAVINLPQAKKRLKLITNELKSIGTDSFMIFSAIDGRKDIEPAIWNKFYLNLHNIDTSTDEGKLALDHLHQGQSGAYMSHYTLIRQIKNSFEIALNELELAKVSHNNQEILRAVKEVRKSSRLLIFEDDAGFGILNKKKTAVSRKRVGVLLRKALSKLPDDWDMLYFIVNATEPSTKISSHLCKLNRSWSLSGYAINNSMYGPLVELLKKIDDVTVTHIWPIDNEIGEIHSFYNVYAINPSIVYHQGGCSHITDRMWLPWQGQPVY